MGFRIWLLCGLCVIFFLSILKVNEVIGVSGYLS
jgi:hypothetical protein